MKKYPIILIIATTLLTACGNKQEEAEKNPLADSLSNVNAQLNSQLSQKEAALQEFIDAFNEIQDNINQIKEKEKIVTNSTQTGDVKSKEETIKEDIQAIYDLLNKNKMKVASLSKKLKDANIKNESLEKMIANLQSMIDEKDKEIEALKDKIEALNIELSNLQTSYQELAQENEVKTEKLYTAYYAIGTAKELKEKGVITKEGGFIGIGKATKLKDDFNKDYFTKIDVTKITSIPISAKSAKVLTTHPSNSYKIVGDKKHVDRIEIINPDEFWSASKFLVIVIE
jgi:DNA repair exonuclease SbcCD ATPase subunit